MDRMNVFSGCFTIFLQGLSQNKWGRSHGGKIVFFVSDILQ